MGSFCVLARSRRDNTVFIFHKHTTNRSQLFLSIKISWSIISWNLWSCDLYQSRPARFFSFVIVYLLRWKQHVYFLSWNVFFLTFEGRIRQDIYYDCMIESSLDVMGHWETLKTFAARNLGHCRSVSFSGSTPVSVVLRKSVRFFRIAQKSPKGNFKDKNIHKFS